MNEKEQYMLQLNKLRKGNYHKRQTRIHGGFPPSLPPQHTFKATN